MRNIRMILTGLIISVAILSGCSSQPEQPHAATPASDKLNPPNRVKAALYEQYQEWKAVKYKSGGLSKSGVDCSGFVYLTYSERFDIKLPRSTEEQIHIGPEISQRDLEPGDLVFFKTGRKIRHVGIYLEDRRFMHASSEHGVTISNLDNDYWASAYWKAVRVRPDNALTAR